MPGWAASTKTQSRSPASTTLVETLVIRTIAADDIVLTPLGPMESTRPFLESIGLPPGDLLDLPSSSKRFPDGAAFRFEIPSTEGPRCLDAVLEEAERREVPVHRVSQGSGGFLLTDAEIDDMVRTAADARVEVSLFAQPTAAWVPSATARSEGGAAVGASSHGQEGIVFALEDIRRSASHGIRSVLITDLGLLAAFDAMREAGELPPEMQAKMSVAFPISNPGTARVLAGMGANTLNVATDLSLAQIAAIRAAVDVPIDFYIEAPDNLGGFVRLYELPELIRVAAPVYVKFGLRNAPNLYPWGTHLDQTAVSLSRERVRRAQLAIEMLRRSGSPMETSAPGAPDLAIPVPQVDMHPRG
jgi:Peptidase family U32